MFLKIDVLMPDSSAYNALHYFSQKVYEALNHLGHQCRLLEGQDRFDKSLETPPDFTIGFNGALQEPHGIFWCDIIQVPHVSILVDPPYYFKNLRYSPFIITTCDDRYYAEAFRSPNFSNLLFLPLGVEIDLEVPSWEARPYDVTFLATFIDYEERQKKWVEKYPKDICDAMMGAIEIATSNEEISFVKAFETTFNQCIQESRDISVFEVNIIDILYELDLFLKGYQRVKLVKAITDAEVHIFKPPGQSPSWEKYTQDQDNIIFHDAVPFEKSVDILKQSKIVLNSTVKKQGSQERVFYGLACGALSFTDENLYLKEFFKDGESIAFYRYHELDQINENINFYLEDELKRKSIAKRGREIVMSQHTWDHRMMALLPQIVPIIEKMKS